MQLILNENFVAELKKFSGNKLKNEEELFSLVNIVIKTGRTDLFEKIVFTAKYINGLKRVLNSGRGNPEITNIGQIREDMLHNYQKLLDQLNLLLEGENDPDMKGFRDKFLIDERESFERLNSFLDDLEWVKMYLNEHKRK